MDYDFQSMTWRAIPSVNALFPNGKPVTYTILTDGKWGGENTPAVLASDLHERVAHHIVSLHNNSLATPSTK